jgi:hypothetical protein
MALLAALCLFSLAGVFALAFSGVDVGWLFVGVMMAALICGVLAAAFRPIQARRTEWAEDDWDDYDIDADAPFVWRAPAPAPRPPLVVRVERPAQLEDRRPSCIVRTQERPLPPGAPTVPYDDLAPRAGSWVDEW